MNEEMKASDLLRAAGRLVERALIKLDTTRVECASCQTQHPHNRVHAQIYNRFTDLQTRLGNAANELDGVADMERHCSACRAPFSVSEEEQAWFKQRHMDIPKACPACRARKRRDEAAAAARH